MNDERLITLRNATGPLHKRLETNLNLLSPSFSRMDYLRLVRAFWGYYRPLEASLIGVPELHDWLPDIAMRSKLPLLAADLKALGVDGDVLDRLSICHELPACTDLTTALGCLYVLEGSTLGGQVISRHLKDLFNLNAENGAAFFTGYGEQTGSMWQTFKAVLMVATVDEDALIHAACETFITLDHWLCSTITTPSDEYL
ncbi:MAG: biliverdin-producing heme oxygenase [Methylococcales bacterium]